MDSCCVHRKSIAARGSVRTERRGVWKEPGSQQPAQAAIGDCSLRAKPLVEPVPGFELVANGPNLTGLDRCVGDIRRLRSVAYFDEMPPGR